MTPQTIAVVHVLGRAYAAAIHVENILELEAGDPRCRALHRAAKDLRKAIAAGQAEAMFDARGEEVTPADAIA